MTPTIEQLVQTQVRVELEQMDLKDIIVTEVRRAISEGVAKDIVEKISSVSESLITDEIQKVLAGEVKTNDGWGKKETYPSFEDLFKSKLGDKLKDRYEVGKIIDKKVNERVASLFNQDYNKVIEKIVDEISKTRLVKTGER
jgi:hypothetical protein